MKNRIWSGAGWIALALAVAVTTPAAAREPVTVGEFVQELARVRQLNATDAHVALVALRGTGVGLPADLELSRTLTHADVVELSRHVGLNVTTRHPDVEFDDGQLRRFFSSFEGQLGGNPGKGSGPGNGKSGPPFDPFTKAKGKGSSKAKFNRTPIE